MRPAQKAPENPPLGRARNVASAGFNEAGAKSAGKPAARPRPERRVGGLQ